MWPFLAAAIPAVASAFGQSQANKTNVRLSREGMAFEADQVQKQMQFQERMSGSSYQRATEDMRLAGINPMLAYAQGGASTPGGGAASGAAATVQDVVGPAVASAQHARRLSEELKNMKATNQNIWHDSNLKYEQQLGTIAAADASRAAARRSDAETALMLADLPGRQVAGQVAGGRFGKATEYIRRGLGSVGPAAAAAAGLFGGAVLRGGAALGRYRMQGSGGVRTTISRGGKGSSTGAGGDYYDLWRNTYTR